VEGDLALRGHPPSLFAGYWNEPEETAAVRRGDWYVTGDRASCDNDGYLWFAGRADDVILSAAYRIGPFEVESALLEHPAVAESAVIGKPDPDRGEIVKAFVVLRGGHEASDELAAELQEHVKTVTAPYKVPREIEFVDELPKTRSGKIRRVELRRLEEERAAPPGAVPITAVPITAVPITAAELALPEEEAPAQETPVPVAEREAGERHQEDERRRHEVDEAAAGQRRSDEEHARRDAEAARTEAEAARRETERRRAEAPEEPEVPAPPEEPEVPPPPEESESPPPPEERRRAEAPAPPGEPDAGAEGEPAANPDLVSRLSHYGRRRDDT
jgi:hypothetical protein